MDFDPGFLRFVAPGTDRLVALAGMLAARGLEYSVLKTGPARHLAVRLGRGAPSLILMAHYDRVDGSPGVLDNSCSCLALADFAARHHASSPSLLVVWSDGEELSGGSEAGDQGARALARALVSAGAARGEAPPPVLVLDVTGRGDRLVLSSAAGDLLARRGLADSPQAIGHRGLVELAFEAASRAGLVSPLLAALPWSDDLGLVLGGMAALTVSLLPSSEAEALSRGASPATWGFLHGPGDALALAEESALGLVAAFLDSLVASLGPPLSPSS